MLNICCTFDVHFLNGRAPGDPHGELTCFTGTGSSLVDYTIVSTALYDQVVWFEIASEDQYTHLPQTFSIQVKSVVKESGSSHMSQENCNERCKFRWSDDSMDKLLSSDQIEVFYNNVIQGNINDAVSTLVNLLQSISKPKHRPVKSLRKTSQQPWWDAELESARAVKFKCLRHMKNGNSETARSKYVAARKKFKTLVRQKKFNHKALLKEKLEKCDSPSEFWKFIRSCKKSKACFNSIKGEEWKAYFSELLNINNPGDDNFSTTVEEYLSWHDVNCQECKQNVEDSNDTVNKDVTLGEIEEAISELDIGKASGVDGISNDILKKAKIVIVPMLHSLFNKMIETGEFPNDWGSALIVPIHKSGDVKDPGNYRGISLLSCLSKVFTKILNNRLVSWAEANEKYFEVQAGFRRGKSAVDNIFVLYSLINKYLSKEKGRFYSVFVDFSKAFDSVPHRLLFYSLLRGNMHGRVINLLRNMYSKLRSCVEFDGYLSGEFNCTVGTRQGCMLSPLLFILYLNELILLTEDNNCQGIYVNENHPNITMLLYADDLVIVGDHVGRVQKILNSLSVFCKKWGLSVNMSKTKSMIFRNGGIIKKNEVFYFNGVKLDHVSYYKYLGVLMSTRLSWSPAQINLSMQACKALNLINQVNYKLDYSFHSACNIFDKCALPVLTYGSEIWGTDVHSSIEMVHLKFCKTLLGVGSKTPTPAVLGECGRDRLFVVCIIKCVKYWLKLMSLSHDSLLHSCYTNLYNQSRRGKNNWASKIRDILYQYGFGWVWENQGVPDQVAFIKLFSERIKDCELQVWSSDVQKLSKLNLYCIFKECRNEELYLTLPIPRRLRIDLARFRTSSHKLEIEMGRHNNIAREDRLCKFCARYNIVAIEDEFHVLFVCAAYEEHRNLYFDNDILTARNNYNFIRLMNCDDANNVVRLANFISCVFKIREQLSLPP